LRDARVVRKFDFVSWPGLSGDLDQGQMSRIPVVAAALAVLLFAAGCAAPEIPFDRSEAGSVHSIGVLTPDIPEKPTVRLASDPGQSFGLVGGLIDAAMETKRNDRLWAILLVRKFVAPNTLSHDLVAALQARGYAAKVVPIERKEGSGFLKTYPPAADSGVDAYLDVSAIGIGYGYVAAGIGSEQPYRPFVWVNCKLVRASDSSVLMEDAVMYNPIGDGKWVTISPDPAYAFPDFDNLTAHPDQAAAGVNTSLQKTAGQIGMLMR
jgi:hypothetical protein